MLVIDTSNTEDQIYASPLYYLMYDCAKDLKLDDEIALDNIHFMFGLPKRVFLSLLETWALKKYNMFLRFNYVDDGGINLIEVGWEDLDDNDIKEVFLNMYPEDVQMNGVG